MGAWLDWLVSLSLVDLELAKLSYQRSTEIIEKMSRNLLMDAFWCESAGGYATSAFKLNDDTDTALQVVKSLKNRIIEEEKPESETGTSREWYCVGLRGSKTLTQYKLKVVQELGTCFKSRGLNQETNDLLSPVLWKYPSVGHHFLAYYESIKMLAHAMEDLGEITGAMHVWTEGRELCHRIKDQDRLNYVRCERARLLWKDHKLDDAEKEFTLVDLRAYFKLCTKSQALDIFMALMNTYVPLGKKEKALQALHEYSPIIESAFTGLQHRLPRIVVQIPYSLAKLVFTLSRGYPLFRLFLGIGMRFFSISTLNAPGPYVTAVPETHQLQSPWKSYAP
jgi:hypothetical protein